jgi:WD40 repeat protein
MCNGGAVMRLLWHSFLFAVMFFLGLFVCGCYQGLQSTKDSKAGDKVIFLDFCFSAESSKIIVGTGFSQDGLQKNGVGSIIIIDAKTLKKEHVIDCEDRVDGVRVFKGNIATFSSDGDHTARIWKMTDTKRPYRQIRVDGGIYGIEFDPGGRFLVFPSIRPDCCLFFWDYEASEVKKVKTPGEFGTTGLAVSRELATAATADAESLHIFDLKKQCLSYSVPWNVSANHSTMAYSPDGKYLAVAGSRGKIQIWGVDEKKEIGTLIGHTDHVGKIAFDSSGRFLASGSSDKSVKLWDVRKRELVHSFSQASICTSVAFAPDSAHLISLGSNGNLDVWDLKTKQKKSVTDLTK